jgi:glycerol-3-phosphate dehydrogenase
MRTPPEEVEVLVIGGGITGTSLANVLHRANRQALLVDLNDFGSGTSQASGMMIWGGLLYLKHFEFRQVRKFCRARDGLLSSLQREVAARSFSYLGSKPGGRHPALVRAALTAYQALALWKRAPVRPFPLGDLPESFAAGRFRKGWTFEEGFLKESDARFTLRRLPFGSPWVTARNHCEIIDIGRTGAGFDGREWRVAAGRIVNCGGVWADGINARFGVATHHEHHLSKGVYLLLRGGGRPDALVMDMGMNGDTLCWVPWGEVVMWGPTETSIASPTGAVAGAEDVDFLLDRLNRYSRRRWTRADIVNVRVGVRPLAIRRGRRVARSLDIPRGAVVEKAPGEAWWTVFGGKLSGASDQAEAIYRSLFREPAPRGAEREAPMPEAPVIAAFGGRRLPDPAHCRRYEHCRTLEDYLRRRTNVAQWVANGGCGAAFEFGDDLLRVAGAIHDGAGAAREAVRDYQRKMIHERERWQG